MSSAPCAARAGAPPLATARVAAAAVARAATSRTRQRPIRCVRFGLDICKSSSILLGAGAVWDWACQARPPSGGGGQAWYQKEALVGRRSFGLSKAGRAVV